MLASALVLFFFSYWSDLCTASVWEMAEPSSWFQPTCMGVSGGGKHALVGTTGGGLWRTDDYGAVYDLVNADVYSWQSVVISSDGHAVGVGEAGIYTSVNYGYNWDFEAASLPTPSLTMSAFGQYVYIASEYIWKSYEYGKNVSKSLDVYDDWKAIKTDNTGQFMIAVSTLNIYYSQDYGRTWFQGFVNSWSWEALQFISLAMNFHGSGAYVGTEDGWVYSTVDYGRNWEPLSPVGEAGMPVHSLACDGDGELLLAGTNTVYRSSNYGRYWEEVDLPSGNNFAWLSLSVSIDGEHATAFLNDSAGSGTVYYSQSDPFAGADVGSSSHSGGRSTVVIIIAVCAVVVGIPVLAVLVWVCALVCSHLGSAKLVPINASVSPNAPLFSAIAKDSGDGAKCMEQAAQQESASPHQQHYEQRYGPEPDPESAQELQTASGGDTHLQSAPHMSHAPDRSGSLHHGLAIQSAPLPAIAGNSVANINTATTLSASPPARTILPPLANRYIFDDATGAYVQFYPSRGAKQ